MEKPRKTHKSLVCLVVMVSFHHVYAPPVVLNEAYDTTVGRVVEWLQGGSVTSNVTAVAVAACVVGGAAGHYVSGRRLEQRLNELRNEIMGVEEAENAVVQEAATTDDAAAPENEADEKKLKEADSQEVEGQVGAEAGKEAVLPAEGAEAKEEVKEATDDASGQSPQGDAPTLDVVDAVTAAAVVATTEDLAAVAEGSEPGGDNASQASSEKVVPLTVRGLEKAFKLLAADLENVRNDVDQIPLMSFYGGSNGGSNGGFERVDSPTGSRQITSELQITVEEGKALKALVAEIQKLPGQGSDSQEAGAAPKQTKRSRFGFAQLFHEVQGLIQSVKLFGEGEGARNTKLSRIDDSLKDVPGMKAAIESVEKNKLDISMAEAHFDKRYMLQLPTTDTDAGPAGQ